MSASSELTFEPSQLLRGKTAWVLAALFAIAMWVQATVMLERPGVTSRLIYTALPVALLAVTLTVALWNRRWLAAGALCLAVAPSVFSSIGMSSRGGAIAVVLACVPFRARHEPGRFVPGTKHALVAVAAVVAMGLWYATGAVREGPSPSWRSVFGSTGDTLKAAVGAVGENGSLVPTTALIAWWFGVGVVVAAALIGGRARLALAIPGSILTFVVASWFIMQTRGPVAPVDGVWILSATVAYVGASVQLDRVPARRLGRVVAVLAAAGWCAAMAQQIRAVVANPSRPGGDWAIWDDWSLSTTSIDAYLLLLLSVVVPAAIAALIWRAAGGTRRPRGVNLIGYFDASSGLGERARTFAAELQAAGVAVTEWTVEASQSPSEGGRTPPPAEDVIYDTTIAVVTALELPALTNTHGPLFTDVNLVAGYWFWELESVPESHLPAIDLVDEIWAPTTFVQDAYRPATSKPVRLVKLPIPQPEASAFLRSRVGVTEDDFLFVTSFDHLSVMERKNPVGVIGAFKAAFPSGDDAVKLLIKTINGDRRPEATKRLREAVGGDPRVQILDEHLPQNEMNGLIAEADAFVSLHRSEGLGLHLADAMWLGTPVVASRYSGSLDLMDDECAALVDVALVGVAGGDGAYPDGFVWADPDLDQAAIFMRRLVDDRNWARNLADQGQHRMRSQPALKLFRML